MTKSSATVYVRCGREKRPLDCPYSNGQASGLFFLVKLSPQESPMFVSRTTLLAAAAACLLTSASVAQSSEGTAMAADSHDKACIQLKDANTWSSNLTKMSGVGTITTLASLLTNLSETYIALTATTHPPVVGYHSGIQRSTADEATTAWTPQGLTTGS